jgi:hypothetical protein
MMKYDDAVKGCGQLKDVTIMFHDAKRWPNWLLNG